MIISFHSAFLFAKCLPGFVETHIFPIEEDSYDHEYDEVPSDGDEEPVDKNSTPEVRIIFYCKKNQQSHLISAKQGAA